MRAGTLREVITIQAKEDGLDEFGGTVPKWVDFATVRARYRPLRGKEVMVAKAERSVATVAFYIRYLAVVNPTMRIVHNGLYHDIESVTDVNGLRQELEIMTATGGNKG